MAGNTQQSRLKELIAQGKEQGFLTYAEVNDHLPEDIADPDQVEDIIAMINDMGISVVEEAPDEDTLMMSDQSADESAAEEAVTALAAVESDVGRTTDPVRMYMREMGTVELLTREGEIEIAKRIEEGTREVMSSLAYLPGAVDSILSAYDATQDEEAPGRLSDLFSGFIDPDEGIPGVAEAEVPEPEPSAADGDVSEDDDEAEEEETGGGPDPEEARARFEQIREQNERAKAAIEEHGLGSKEASAEQARLAELFSPIKLVPKHFERLVGQVRISVEQIRGQEKAIMQIFVKRPRCRARPSSGRFRAPSPISSGWTGSWPSTPSSPIVSSRSVPTSSVPSARSASRKRWSCCRSRTSRKSIAACRSARPRRVAPRRKWSRPTCVWLSRSPRSIPIAACSSST